MEGGFGFPLGGDPEELMKSLQEFAARQAESVAEAQREQFATLTLSTAVELTGAALKRMTVEGGPDEQAIALRDAMRVLFPEAVALVSAARQGFMRESVTEALDRRRASPRRLLASRAVAHVIARVEDRAAPHAHVLEAVTAEVLAAGRAVAFRAAERHPVRLPLLRQQNHSPEVWQAAGQPAPSAQVLHGKPAFVQIGPTPTHGLHGPPPQPTQPATEPRETSVRVSQSPAPSEPAPRNLKNCRREERRARR